MSMCCAVVSVPCSLVEKGYRVCCVFLCFVTFPYVSWSTLELMCHEKDAKLIWFKYTEANLKANTLHVYAGSVLQNFSSISKPRLCQDSTSHFISKYIVLLAETKFE